MNAARTVRVNLDFTATTSQAEAALSRLNTNLRNISSQTNLDTGGLRLPEQLNTASVAAIKLRENLQNAINVDTGKLDLSKFNHEMEKSGMSLKQYRDALVSLGPTGQAAFMDLSKAILASETPLRQTNVLVDKLWDSLKRTAGWQLSSTAIHAFVGAISTAYNYAQDLNKSLNDIRIVTGYGSDRMAEFAKNANKAAKQLSATTLDYTNASLIYYQQGLDDKAVQERSDVTVKMANVTGTAAQTVSDQLTAIWENFMKDGKHAAEWYADVMTALGAETASSTDEIAEGLEKFAAVADTVGLSYEYATAALTTITAKTRQSADVVGTALKTLFARIEGLNLGETLDDGTTLNKYSKALDAVGVNIKNEAGELKSMDEILDEIGAKWDTIGKDQQIALAQTVAGVRQYTQFIALMDNWDFMKENLNTVANATGTLDKQAEIYAESWEAAKKRVQAAAESIYQDLLKDDFFIQLTDDFGSILEFIDSIIDSLGGLSGVLPGIALLVNKIFGDKIIAGTQTLAHNLMNLTAAGRAANMKRDVSRYEEVAQLQKGLNPNSGLRENNEATAVSTTADRVLAIQKQILGVKGKITEEDRKHYQIMLDAVQASGEELQARAKQLDLAQEEARLSANEIRSKASFGSYDYLKGAGSSSLRAIMSEYDNGTSVNDIALPASRGAQQGVIDQLNSNLGLNGSTALQLDDLTNKTQKFQQALQSLSTASVQSFIKDFDGLGESIKNNARYLAEFEHEADQLDNLKLSVGNWQKDPNFDLEGYKQQFRDLGFSISDAADAEELLTAVDNASAEALRKSQRAAAGNTAQIEQFAKKYKLSTDEVQRFANQLKEAEKRGLSYKEYLEQTGEAAVAFGDSVSNTSKKVDKLAVVQGVANTLFGIGMSVSAVTNAIESLQDDSISPWQKTLNIIMALSMTLPTVATLFTSLGQGYTLLAYGITGYSAAQARAAVVTLADMGITQASTEADKKAAAAKLALKLGIDEESAAILVNSTLQAKSLKTRILELATKIKEAVVTGATTVATWAHNAALAVQNLLMGKSLVLTTASIAAFAGLGIILAVLVAQLIKGIAEWANYETATEQATRQAEESAAAADKAKEAFNSLKDTLKEYDEGVSALADLTEGTEAFREKLAETNKAALELIEQLQLIYGKDWKYDDNGQIVFLDEKGQIDKNFVKNQTEESEKQYQQTQNVAVIANAAVSKTEATDVNSFAKYNETYYKAPEKSKTASQIVQAGIKASDIDSVIQSLGENITWDANNKSFSAGDYDKIREALVALGYDKSDVGGIDNFSYFVDDLYYQKQNNGQKYADRLDYMDKLATSVSAGEGQVVGTVLNDVNSKVKGALDDAQLDKIAADSYSKAATKTQDAQAEINQLSESELKQRYAQFNSAYHYNADTGALQLQDEEGNWTDLKEGDEGYVSIDTIRKNLKTNIQVEKAQELANSEAEDTWFTQFQKDASSSFSGEQQNEVNNLLRRMYDNKSGKPLTEEDIQKNVSGLSPEDVELLMQKQEELRGVLTDVNDLYTTGQQDLLGLADEYSSCSDEAEEFSAAVKRYGKNSEQAKKAQDKLNQAVKNAQWRKLADSVAKVLSNMEDLDEESDEYKDECKSLAKSFNDIFKTNVTQDWVADNIDLFKKWSQSSGDEARKLELQILAAANAASNENFKPIVLKADGTGAEQTIRTAYDFYLYYKSLIESGKITITAEGKADISALLNALDLAEVSAADVAAILSAIGQTDVTINGVVVSTAEMSASGSSFADFMAAASDAAGSPMEVKDFQSNVTATGVVPDFNPGKYISDANSSGGGGGGGGGGSQKDKKKSSDEIERYHTIKKQLDNLSREYDNLSAAKDRAFGANRLRVMDQEAAKLEEQIAAQKRYVDEIDSYYSQDRAAIAAYGAVFDENGIITNYEQIMQEQLDIFNASLTDEAEESYNDFKDILNQYEETLELKLSEADKLIEQEYDKISLQLEKITYSVEIKVQIHDDQIDFLERRLDRLSNSERRQYDSYLVQQEKVLELQQKRLATQQGIDDLQAAIAEHEARGLEMTDEENEQLRTYKETLADIDDQIFDIKFSIIEDIGTVFDNYFDDLDYYIDRISTLNDMMETTRDTLDLLGYDNLDIFNDINKQLLSNQRTMLGMSQQKLSSATDEVNYWQDLATFVEGINSLDDLKNSSFGANDSVKKIAENAALAEDSIKAVKDAINNQLKEATERQLETQQEIYESINDIVQAIEDNWVDAVEKVVAVQKKGLLNDIDYAVDRYGDLADLNDLYLSNSKKIYELNKLNRTILQDISKTDNVAAKSKLKDVLEEVNALQNSNAQMSEYELKTLQAKYDLRLAEIALEEAQEAKSQVRLVRDNEGNWGYMYTADAEEVSKAEQDVEDKMQALQDIQEETMRDMGQNILQVQKDYFDAFSDISTDTSLTWETKSARIKELQGDTMKKLTYYTDQYDKALKQSGINFKDTILGTMYPEYENLQKFNDGFASSANTTFAQIQKQYEVTTGYYRDLAKAMGITDENVLNNLELMKAAIADAMLAAQKNMQTAISKSQENFDATTKNMNDLVKTIKEMGESLQKWVEEMTKLAAVFNSNADYFDLMIKALKNNDMDSAEKYAEYRAMKISLDPNSYGQYDWSSKEAMVKDFQEQGVWISDEKANSLWDKYSSTLKKYDTGGYTGEWGQDGKLAVLHQKELVLNASDTANMLDIVNVVRDIVRQIDAQALYSRGRRFDLPRIETRAETLEQNVHIEANFPNATSHQEIEQAFDNLINLASQYANKK